MQGTDARRNIPYRSNSGRSGPPGRGLCGEDGAGIREDPLIQAGFLHQGVLCRGPRYCQKSVGSFNPISEALKTGSRPACFCRL